MSGNADEVAVLEWWVTGRELMGIVARIREGEGAGSIRRASPAAIFGSWPGLSVEDFRTESEVA